MRRFLMLVAIGAVALACLGVASANAPIRSTFLLDGVTFSDAVLSASCGFTVNLTLNGTIKATLFLDANGNVVREVDTQPSGTLTYSSAAGGSISFPWSIISHTDYSAGTAIGSPVTITLTGNIGSFTGIVGPGTGRLVLTGEVVGVFGGAPLTAFTGLVSMSGNFTGETSKICAALAG
jgi:hypothetical protein